MADFFFCASLRAEYFFSFLLSVLIYFVFSLRRNRHFRLDTIFRLLIDTSLSLRFLSSWYRSFELLIFFFISLSWLNIASLYHFLLLMISLRWFSLLLRLYFQFLHDFHFLHNIEMFLFFFIFFINIRIHMILLFFVLFFLRRVSIFTRMTGRRRNAEEAGQPGLACFFFVSVHVFLPPASLPPAAERFFTMSPPPIRRSSSSAGEARFW